MVSFRLIGEMPIPYARSMVNLGMVNGAKFQFLRTAKIAIFRDSAYENAILKLH